MKQLTVTWKSDVFEPFTFTEEEYTWMIEDHLLTVTNKEAPKRAIYPMTCIASLCLETV